MSQEPCRALQEHSRMAREPAREAQKPSRLLRKGGTALPHAAATCGGSNPALTRPPRLRAVELLTLRRNTPPTASKMKRPAD